jgi:putative sigma-54 modulation protein
MEVEVRIFNDKFCLTSSLREHLDRRLQYSFSGVHNNILLAYIRLRDLNEPRGGSDMMCEILVTIPGCPAIVIREVHEDMYTAINFAVERAAHRAKRLLLQRRQVKKRRRVFIPGLQPKISTA